MDYWVLGVNIVILLLNVYLSFIKSYLSEKGKRTAMKDDIDSITETVEGIRNKFNKETEFLRSKLNILTQNKISLATEERDAIFDFYTKYYHWINLMKGNTILSSEYGKEDFDRIEYDLKLAELDYENSEAKINLFISDKEFYEIKDNLVKEVLHLQYSFKKWLTEAKYILVEKEYINPNNKVEENQRINNKFHATNNHYSKELLDNYKNVLPYQRQLRDYLNKRLKETIQDR